MIECFKRGLFLQGIFHDASKLLPDEFFPYLNWFYRQNEFDDENEKTGQKPYIFIDCGMGKIFFKSKQDIKKEFDIAWLKHIHRNPHHWQYWILQYDSGNTECLCIPEKYVKEMVADWIGAGIAITGKRDVLGWYDKNKDNIKLNPDTRVLLEYYLGLRDIHGRKIL